MWGEEPDTLELENVTFSDLENGKEYYVSWVNNIIRSNHNIHERDTVRVNKIIEAAVATGLINIIKTCASNGFPVVAESFEVSYMNITLAVAKKPFKQKCTCDNRALMWHGCHCGAFKKGDK